MGDFSTAHTENKTLPDKTDHAVHKWIQGAVPGNSLESACHLTHCGRVTQICVFNTVKVSTSASSP